MRHRIPALSFRFAAALLACSLGLGKLAAEPAVDRDCGCGSPTFDCNENGIEDAVDIATGSSADMNGNGVPDECEGAHRR